MTKLQGGDALGVLTRELPVRVINCSLSGCLIEITVRLEIGTVGSLRVFIDGREFVDPVQVVRCHRIEGGGTRYHVGARFLWIAAPEEGSLRVAVRYLVANSPVQFTTTR